MAKEVKGLTPAQIVALAKLIAKRNWQGQMLSCQTGDRETRQQAERRHGGRRPRRTGGRHQGGPRD